MEYTSNSCRHIHPKWSRCRLSGDYLEKKIVAIIAVAILTIAGAAIVFSTGGGNDDKGRVTGSIVGYDGPCTVYLVVDGETQELHAEADDIWGALTGALPAIEIDSAGRVTSVKGQSAGEGQAWTVWNWTSVDGWERTTVSKTKPVTASTRLAVVLSDAVKENGVTTYTEPSIHVDYEVYFLLMFKEDFSKNEYIKSFMTESDRKAGVWVRGTGTNAAEALLDVANKMGWGEDSCSLRGDTGQTGWFDVFFGLTDISHTDGSWTYWSQFQWVGGSDGEWRYNTHVLGGCELTDGVCFALIRQTAQENDAESTAVTPVSIPASLIAGS